LQKSCFTGEPAGKTAFAIPVSNLIDAIQKRKRLQGKANFQANQTKDIPQSVPLSS
jgi:hypothetical protein